MTTQAQITVEDITRRAEWLAGRIEDSEGRLARSTDAGGRLAAAIYEFIGNPQDVGLDALRAAYGEFMSLHAGNFGPPLVTT